jgi:hypothetical protein
MSTTVEQAIAAVGGDRETLVVDVDLLRQALTRLGLVGGLHAEALERATRAVWAGQPFEASVGPWSIDVSRALLRSALSAAILVVAARRSAVDGLPVIVLAMVLPLLVDIDRVEVRAAEEVVLGALRSSLATRGDIESFYAELPPDLREQITLADFCSLVDGLVQRGALSRDAVGVYELPEAPYGVLRLTLDDQPNDPGEPDARPHASPYL